MKQYIERNGQTFKVMIDYTKIPFFSNQKRGYYLTVVPVKIIQREGYSLEETGAFTGFRNLLLEVERKSNKAYNKAVELGTPLIEKFIEAILNKQN